LIDKWLDNKKVQIYLNDSKIDFSMDNEKHVRQFERFLPSIPLKSGFYSDTGSRMRLNKFKKVDGMF
jgi:hypothetical protein